MRHGRVGRRFAGIVLIGALIGAFAGHTIAAAQTDPGAGYARAPHVGPKDPAPEGSGSDVGANVVGGVPVSTASFPWEAALLFTSESDPFQAQFCAGALIDPQYVLTSADCVLGATAGDIDVALGHDDLNTIQPADRRTLVSITKDPLYNSGTGEHNTALLKLTSPALGIPTAAYGIDNTTEAAGTTGGFLGWGETEFGFLSTLHGGGATVLTSPSTTSCSTWVPSAYVNTSMMCIGQSLAGGYPATCDFDEGDPFVVGSPGGYRVVGLNLGGPPTCGQDLPDIYARVSASATFISDTLSPPGAVGTFHGIPPIRILDTRNNNVGGLGSGPVGPSGVINPQVTGFNGVSGVPYGVAANAVVLNLVATGPTGGGWLTAFPTGGAPPTAANLNFNPGATVANLVTVQLGQGGKISIANSYGSPSAGYVNIIADVVGWYGNNDVGATFQAATPRRIVDTRVGTPDNPTLATQLVPGTPQTATVCGGSTGVDAGATAVVVNGAAIGGGTDGWFTMWPTGAAPTVSNVNYAPGQTAASLAVVKVGPSCTIQMGNSPPATAGTRSPIDVILDVVGWYGSEGTIDGARFHAMAPNRILDTRTGTTDNPGIAPIAGGGTINVNARDGSTGVPVSAVAIIANTTAIGPAFAGWLTVYPADPVPPIASVNFGAGAVVANLVGVGFPAGNAVRLGNTTYPTPVGIPQGPVNVAMDVSGWFE